MTLRLDKAAQGRLWDERVLFGNEETREEPTNLDRARQQIRLAIDSETDPKGKLAAATTALALMDLERLEYSQRQADKPPAAHTTINHFGTEAPAS